jgi:hypothetical protein
MHSRLGFERRDGRNLLVTAGVMTLLFFLFLDGSAGSRLAAALVGGLAAALTFLVVTLLINAFKPDHW